MNNKDNKEFFKRFDLEGDFWKQGVSCDHDDKFVCDHRLGMIYMWFEAKLKEEREETVKRAYARGLSYDMRHRDRNDQGFAMDMCNLLEELGQFGETI